MKSILVTGGSGFIGTNLVESLAVSGAKLLNLDLREPLNAAQIDYWHQGDVMARGDLKTAFDAFKPDYVIHMAARTDCVENTTVEEGYAVNYVGTENVLRAVAETPTVKRLIVVSSQYVCGPGRKPEHDEDFFPHTVYGQSKVLAEKVTRQINPGCVWTIVRPSNIWGPWHIRYSREAWRVIEKGLYLHPAGDAVVRTYGYVGNVVWQMEQILQAPAEKLDRQVFFVGDRPIDIYEWTDGFSMALRGKHARKVPRVVLRGIGLVGDILKLFGVTFPLTSSRVTSMTQDYAVPMEKTFDVFGEPPYSLQEGVEKTVEWLKSNRK